MPTQAISALADAAQEQLPQTMRTEWTELALLQLQTGDTAMWVFLLAVVLVFLVLAAQYESWALPLAVILVVPTCLLCAITGVVMAHMDINIFTQIGFLVLVGLACKNAILIVEFAKAQREAGHSRRVATLQACQLRLRPIIMTSFAFVLGVVPLMLSEGAGAEMRQTLGTAVFAGMLGVTLFGIFLTPVFFYVIQWLADSQAVSGTLVPETGSLNDQASRSHQHAHLNGDGQLNGKAVTHAGVRTADVDDRGQKTIDELETAILALRASQDESSREQAVDSLTRLAQKLKERLH
jgi:multidrug efflux pump